MDKKNKDMIFEDPNYMKLGIILMERINTKDLSLTASHDGQTAEIIRGIQQNIDGVNKNNLWSHLPQLSSEELAARATKAIVGPFKKIDNNNPFLSQWNEITAVNAADRLGIPQKKLQRLIAQNGPVAQRLRSMQATVSIEMEETIRRNSKQNGKSDPAFFVSMETWISKLIEEQRKFLNNTAPQLSKEHKGLVIKDVLSAFIKILDFAPLQNIPADLLKSFLLLARLGTPINVIDLHCLTFVNSTERGIEVSESAEDFTVLDTEGNAFRISQADIWDGVCQFANILNQFSIEHEVVIFVIDNDKFVMPGQERRVEKFVNSLEDIIQKHPISENKFSIVRSSEVVELKEFIDEWERRNQKGDKLTERLVNEEFERLQKRTLPKSFHTRLFAREVAKKSFLVQVSLGATIPVIFKPSIVLQSTKAQQQATEIFRLGSTLTSNEKPIIIAHWKGRQKI